MLLAEKPLLQNALFRQQEQYLGDEAMTPHLLRQRQPAGHQYARPVDCVEAQDVLANDVVCWPTMLL